MELQTREDDRTPRRVKVPRGPDTPVALGLETLIIANMAASGGSSATRVTLMEHQAAAVS
jgi:hypothetical protein